MIKKAISVVITALALGVFAYFFYLASQTPKEIVQFAAQKQGSIPMCLVRGSMFNPNDTQKEGINTLGNMIRVRYEVETGEQCKDVAIALCKKHTAEGAVPGTLGLSLQRKDSAEERYILTRDCVLKAE